jgi:hypothetical protein
MDSALNKINQKGRPKAEYANYFEIGHNACEFILDFAQLHNGDEYPKYVARIVSNPFYFKGLVTLLLQAIKGYEDCHGHILDDETSTYLVCKRLGNPCSI